MRLPRLLSRNGPAEMEWIGTLGVKIVTHIFGKYTNFFDDNARKSAKQQMIRIIPGTVLSSCPHARCVHDDSSTVLVKEVILSVAVHMQ